MFFTSLLLLLQFLFELSNLLLQLAIIFLLKHQLLHEIFTVCFLTLEFGLQYLVFLFELAILSFCALGNISDEFQVMLKLIFALSLFSSFVTTLGLLLLNRLLGTADQALIATSQLLRLFIL